MEQRKLGQLEVSVVGLGCNNFGGRIDATATNRVVAAAIEAGINFFDTADVYGGGASEELLGKAIGGRRSEVLIATKFGSPGRDTGEHKRGSANWVKLAVEESLKKLGSDYIDYYQIHFPDPEVPIAETLGAMHDLVTAGKVREIGCSNFGSGRLQEAAQTATDSHLSRFSGVQNRYSVLTRDPEERVLPTCKTLGMGLIPYFPLESGLLTGKYTDAVELPPGSRLAGMSEQDRKRFMGSGVFEKISALSQFAEASGYTLLDLAISWLVSNPGVTSIIAGATKPEQVIANVEATRWKMSPHDLGQIDSILAT